MKTIPQYAIRLLATLGALLVVDASQVADAAEKKPVNQSNSIFATGPADGGRLIIGRSPVLGDNVSISVYVDGKVAGTLVRNRTFDKYITPGRHVLVASPNRMSGDWRRTLDIKAGQTYNYVASFVVNRLVLDHPSMSW